MKAWAGHGILSGSPAAYPPRRQLEREVVLLEPHAAFSNRESPGRLLYRKHLSVLRVFGTFWNFPEQDSARLCPYSSHQTESLRACPAALLLPSLRSVELTSSVHAESRFLKICVLSLQGRFWSAPLLSLLLILRAFLLGLFPRLLKKIKLFSSQSAMLVKGKRLKFGGRFS